MINWALPERGLPRMDTYETRTNVQRRERKVEWLTKRSVYLECELQREEQHHTIGLKEVITLK